MKKGYTVLSIRDCRRLLKIVREGKKQAESNGIKRPNYCHIFENVRVTTDDKGDTQVTYIV